MSLWTPGGERPVGRDQPAPGPGGAPPGSGAGAGAGPAAEDLSPQDHAELRAMQDELAEVRAQLLQAPASVVVANHAMGIYELAALHLTASEPNLPEAVLAIDALAALVEGLTGRLGDAEPTLQEALTQLRAAYLEVSGARG
jgi:uncharacterized protein involved in exopolysaccharide biosynthesis